MTRFFNTKRLKIGNQKGFTLIELMIVVAIIGILAAIAIPLFANVQARARIAKVQADLRAMASAISLYQAHTGTLPGAGNLSILTTTVANAQNQTGGPFLGAVPTPPAGWGAYSYSNPTTDTFQISSSGDSTGVTVP